MNTSRHINTFDGLKSQGLQALSNSSNVVRLHTATAKNRALLKLWTTEELEALTDPEWLIADILPENGFAVIFGPPGSKKSFIALDWASCIASGQSWNGREVKQGDVVYIYAEGKSALKLRNAAWREHHKVEPEGLRFINQAVNVSDPNKVKHLIASIRAGGVNPQFLIIDTLARNFGNGDENSAKDMNAFVAGADALREAFPGCTVLVVHHTGKDARHGARGSSVLNGAEDTAIEAVSGADAKQGHINCKKQKDADCFATMGFRLLPVGKSAVLDWSTVTSAGAASGAVQVRITQSDIAILKAILAFPDGVTFTELRSHSKVTDRTFADAVKRLKEQGKLLYDDVSKLYSAGPDRSAEPH
ncbi:AAA family ATPase [Phyllobacterium endophyticum]|uniref:AAA family ATPase n=1 Tax=Phyllobacterium endophyticum TaxID=1149773 RepID=A0A2P7AW09_9HYPH|nr:AAA family ATPase [Phyllobacterium endophyticum]MBB3234991.1 hypothetical protein [Phyllobacterium endophyticum]PSH58402.1 hypothetical protein CU100_12410 [Phyllobacterium endophyticum]TYR39073.1 AAA family ATPase [Phyllobacterium endophyticum]